MKKVQKITIIGAGNGGITAAADLKKKGFDVVLFDLKEKYHKLSEIVKNNGILFKYKGTEEFIEGIVCSTNEEEAVYGSDIVMFTLPGLLVEKYAEVIAPVVNCEQLVFFNSAASMSCIRFINKARSMGIKKDFFLAEANSLTYATRANFDKGSVNLTLKVKETLVASLPKENTKKACELLSQIYDGILEVEDIWRVNLENANPEVHPGVCLLNVGQIEKYPDTFSLYRDGYSEHTANLLKAIAIERREIAKKFGYEMEGIIDSRINRGYFSDDVKEIHLMFNESPVFSKINGPSSVQSRYFIEDIEDGLVLWSSLGRIAGVETKAIDAVIYISSIVIGIDFYKEGLSLESLGLGGKTLEELKSIV